MNPPYMVTKLRLIDFGGDILRHLVTFDRWSKKGAVGTRRQGIFRAWFRDKRRLARLVGSAEACRILRTTLVSREPRSLASEALEHLMGDEPDTEEPFTVDRQPSLQEARLQTVFSKIQATGGWESNGVAFVSLAVPDTT